jgi:hypothetical protein
MNLLRDSSGEGAFELSPNVGAMLRDVSMDGLSVEELLAQADTLM